MQVKEQLQGHVCMCMCTVHRVFTAPRPNSLQQLLLLDINLTEVRKGRSQLLVLIMHLAPT
jgi:hypothetical protein